MCGSGVFTVPLPHSVAIMRDSEMGFELAHEEAAQL